MTGCGAPAATRLAVAGLVAVIASGAGLRLAANASAAVTTVRDEVVTVKQPQRPGGLDAKAYIVIDRTTGRVLLSRHGKSVRPIASTTKIMTALVAIARTEPGERLRASGYRGTPGESMLGLTAGERMTVDDLLKALLLTSANDAADTFAVRLAESRQDFVAAMNARARALGLNDTRYGNAIGLDQPRTVSTAADLAQAARVALAEPRFASIVRRRSAKLRSGAKRRTVYNRNDLVRNYKFVDGVKTGHTNKAGFVLVGSSKRRQTGVIAVVLGEPSIPARNRETLKLLRFGRAHFRDLAAASDTRPLVKLPVWLQDAKAAVVAKENVRLAASNGQRLVVKADLPTELKGPIEQGTRVGTATISLAGKQINKVVLVTASDIPEASITAVLVHQLGKALALLLVASLLFMMVMLMRSRSKRRGGGHRQKRAAGDDRLDARTAP